MLKVVKKTLKSLYKNPFNDHLMQNNLLQRQKEELKVLIQIKKSSLVCNVTPTSSV